MRFQVQPPHIGQIQRAGAQFKAAGSQREIARQRRPAALQIDAVPQQFAGLPVHRGAAQPVLALPGGVEGERERHALGCAQTVSRRESCIGQQQTRLDMRRSPGAEIRQHGFDVGATGRRVVLQQGLQRRFQREQAGDIDRLCLQRQMRVRASQRAADSDMQVR